MNMPDSCMHALALCGMRARSTAGSYVSSCPFGTPRTSGRWSSALQFRIRRTVLTAKSPCSIGAGLQRQVDVRIGGFIPRSPVSHDQKGRIVVGFIQKVVTITSASRECDTRAGPHRLASRIGDEHEL